MISAHAQPDVKHLINQNKKQKKERKEEVK